MAGKTEEQAPAYRLVVVEPFGDYRRGDAITDTSTIKKILDSDSAGNVRKVKGE